jgi:toxin YoeB
MKSRETIFSQSAFGELKDWIKTSPKVATKILELLEECGRTPFDGKGKPEPLKGNYKGYWSRRITEEDRLVYRVDDNNVYVAACKGHYE